MVIIATKQQTFSMESSNSQKSYYKIPFLEGALIRYQKRGLAEKERSH